MMALPLRFALLYFWCRQYRYYFIVMVSIDAFIMTWSAALLTWVPRYELTTI